MFTGIIRYQGKVVSRSEKNDLLALSFAVPKGLKLKSGQSINVNGICSTIKSVSGKTWSVDYMRETRKKTTVDEWSKGTPVNLEVSASLRSALDGHIVQGHIDATGTIEKIAREGGSKILTIRIPKEYMKFIAPKGSVAIDGVSLTIANARGGSFSVALVPYTLTHTNLDALKKGDVVNLETDIIARYLWNLKK